MFFIVFVFYFWFFILITRCWFKIFNFSCLVLARNVLKFSFLTCQVLMQYADCKAFIDISQAGWSSFSLLLSFALSSSPPPHHHHTHLTEIVPLGSFAPNTGVLSFALEMDTVTLAVPVRTGLPPSVTKILRTVYDMAPARSRSIADASFNCPALPKINVLAAFPKMVESME